jgi:hypothetical protein
VEKSTKSYSKKANKIKWYNKKHSKEASRENRKTKNR